jgi:hypothetical protein
MTMGDMDDGMHDVENLPVEFLVMYQSTHTDGYTHSSSGPLYESKDGADFVSKQENNGYAREAKAIACARIAGRTYIIDGPYKTIKDLEMEDKIRAAALAKLTEAEKKVLGVK